MEDKKFSSMAHLGAGVFSGMCSFYIGKPLYAFVFALVAAFFTGKALESKIGKKGLKWWFGNGLIIYFFVWLISWVFLLNI